MVLSINLASRASFGFNTQFNFYVALLICDMVFPCFQIGKSGSNVLVQFSELDSIGMVESEKYDNDKQICAEGDRG